MKIAVLILLLSWHNLQLFYSQSIEKASFFVESVSVTKGKKVTTNANTFLDMLNGEMVSYFYKPMEFIVKTNIFGESKVYYPETNQVILDTDEKYSFKNDFFVEMVTNPGFDMGLSGLGMVYDNERVEDGLTIITWKNKELVNSPVATIELVYQEQKPVCSIYYSKENKIIRKIYYSNYIMITDILFPARVTEILYTTENDSIINRKVYSNIMVNDSVNPDKLNFQIPLNAKLLSK